MFTPALLLALSGALSGALAGDRLLYDQAVRLIETHYLRASSVDPGLALRGAAEAAEQAVPWLIADTEGEGVALRQGAAAPFARVQAAPTSLGELPAALEELEDAIRARGTPLPAGTELAVELLRGATDALDRPSIVLAGERLDRFDERIRGTASGVGARVGMVAGELTVKSTFEDSPARQGGLEPGDILIRIDGASTLGMSVTRAVDLIRGPEGSKVTLGVRRVREGSARELDLTLTRAEMVLPNVEWERRDNLGWMRIDHFSDRTESLMKQGLAELESEGPLSGLVLDLRGNAGGSMIQAARTADLFLDQGLLVRTAGRGGAPVDGLLHEVHARPGADRLNIPVVVLVDDQSASASEILAGALQVHGRAVLLGDRTYGKGTVQKIFTLRGGDDPVRLKLTVAEYRLDGDVPVADVGLAPDLWSRTAVLGRSGANLPEQGPAGERAVMFVDERPGWRDGEGPPLRPDPLRALGEELLRTTTGGGHAAMLAALDAVTARAAQAEEARLLEALAARGIDWTVGAPPSGAPPALYESGPPPVIADLSLEEPPAPGARVHLVAQVRATGDAPLSRALLRIVTEDGDLPWDGVVLPIGRLMPGEEREARATVAIPLSAARRQDVLQLRFESEGGPVQALGSQVVEIAARPPPAVQVTARLSPSGDHHEVGIQLANQGQGALTGVRVRFAYPEDPGIELLQREAGVAALGAGDTAPLRLQLRLAPDHHGPVKLDLVVDAEQLVDPMSLPLALGMAGEPQVVSPPTLSLDAPLSVLPGPMVVGVEARDDQGLGDLSVWQGEEKIAWATGNGRRLQLGVTVQVPAGPTILTARVHDSDGVETEQRVVVRGVPDGDAAAQGHSEGAPEIP